MHMSNIWQKSLVKIVEKKYDMLFNNSMQISVCKHEDNNKQLE